MQVCQTATANVVYLFFAGRGDIFLGFRFSRSMVLTILGFSRVIKLPVKKMEDQLPSNVKWYRLGSVIVAVGVLAVSSWPTLSFSTFDWSFEDKLQHTLVYAILAYLAYRGWVPADTTGNRRGAKWLILIVLACFAAADEYHQRWIPGRFVEWGDFLADGIGVLFGFVLGAWRNHSRRKRITADPPP